MTIECLNIIAFGKLRNYQVNLGGGVHIIEGGNESGKSTLAAFIRFILYGFPADAAGEEERKRRTSRLTRTAEGSMTVSVAGGRYRVDRYSEAYRGFIEGRYHERVSITDLSDDRVVDTPLSPGEYLLGVGRELYETAAFLAQPEAGVRDGAVIRNNVEDLIFSGKRHEVTQRAVDILSGERDSLLNFDGTGGRIREVAAQAEGLRGQLTAAMSEQRDVLSLNHDFEEETRIAAEAKRQWERCRNLAALHRNYRTLTVFEELHRQEEVAAGIAKEKEAFLRRTTRNGFFPDEGYRTEVAFDRAAFTSASERGSAARERLRAVTAEEPMTREAQKNLLRAEKSGGETKVYQNFRARRTGFRRLLWITAALFALFAGLVALTVLLAVAGKTGDLVCGILAGLACLAAVTLTVFTVRSLRSLHAVCADYGAANGRELRAKLEAVTRGRTATDAHTKALHRAQKDADDAALAEQSARAELETLLHRWGGELPRDGGESAYLDAFEADIADTLSAFGDLTMREVHSNERLHDLHAALDGYREEEVRGAVPESRRAILADMNPDDIQAGIDRFREEYETHTGVAAALRNRIGDLESKAKNPAAICEKLCQQENELTRLERRRAALDTALGILRGAEQNLRTELTPKLSYYVRELTAVMTDGKYADAGVGGDLKPVVREGGVDVPAAELSDSARDTVYIALRFALIRLLFRETPPMCFDDSFAGQDDRRVSAILRVLFALAKQSGVQSFVFTRQNREYTIAREIGDCVHITLTAD